MQSRSSTDTFQEENVIPPTSKGLVVFVRTCTSSDLRSELNLKGCSGRDNVIHDLEVRGTDARGLNLTIIEVVVRPKHSVLLKRGSLCNAVVRVADAIDQVDVFDAFHL